MDVQGIPDIGETIAAIAALGTAAFGLVDASKALWGGASNVGFGRIKAALSPFNPALETLRNSPWLTLRANWLNGAPKADQKAAAKALIHLTLSPKNAHALADAVGIDAHALRAAATKINNGAALSKTDMDILGRFDALVSTVLDAGYERAEQQYRNTAKLLSALVAIVLAVIAGYLIQVAKVPQPAAGLTFGKYLASRDFVIAFIVGAVSTPLAPIAKDLSTSLAAAVKAVGSLKR